MRKARYDPLSLSHGWIQDLLRLGRGWWDHLVAADPGQIRLQLALRTTTVVALSLAVLHSLGLAANLPGTIIVLGLVESLFGSISVRDPETGEQRKTLLLTPLPAAASFTLGTALAPFKVSSDITFLAVIFAGRPDMRWRPVWHLSNDGAWMFSKNSRWIGPEDFEPARKPNSLREWHARFGHIAMPAEMLPHWRSPRDRAAPWAKGRWSIFPAA